MKENRATESLLQRAGTEHPLVVLQKTVGNREVARWLASRRQTSPELPEPAPRVWRRRPVWMAAAVILLTILALLLYFYASQRASPPVVSARLRPIRDSAALAIEILSIADWIPLKMGRDGQPAFVTVRVCMCSDFVTPRQFPVDRNLPQDA